MEKILDKRTIRIDISTISNSGDQKFAPVDKMNITIYDNDEQIINTTIKSSIYYKSPNPVRELEKYISGLYQSNTIKNGSTD